MVFHAFWSALMGFSLHFFLQFAPFFLKLSGLMVLRFTDHHMRLFLMIANHQSRDANFAIYKFISL